MALPGTVQAAADGLLGFDTDSIVNAGTTKKITSHSQPGSTRTYGVNRCLIARAFIFRGPCESAECSVRS